MREINGMLPSEKAFWCRKQYEQLKMLPVTDEEKAGKKGKGNKRFQKERSGSKSEKKMIWTDSVLAEKIGVSRSQLHRYLRLTYVDKKLLDLVDTGELSVMTAVEISFIDEETQVILYAFISKHRMVKSYEVKALRSYLAEHGHITLAELEMLLNRQEAEGKRENKEAITFTEKKIREYFPSGYRMKEIENMLVGFMEYWKNEQEK